MTGLEDLGKNVSLVRFSATLLHHVGFNYSQEDGQAEKNSQHQG